MIFTKPSWTDSLFDRGAWSCQGSWLMVLCFPVERADSHWKHCRRTNSWHWRSNTTRVSYTENSRWKNNSHCLLPWLLLIRRWYSLSRKWRITHLESIDITDEWAVFLCLRYISKYLTEDYITFAGMKDLFGISITSFDHVSYDIMTRFLATWKCEYFILKEVYISAALDIDKEIMFCIWKVML